jgi:hypothetical protein
MSKFSKGVANFAAEAIAIAIGWAICLGILAGAYGVGWWMASHLGDANVSNANRSVLGLLSALAFLWLYERRDAKERYDRLRELLDCRSQ